jgi:hypothetical protein
MRGTVLRIRAFDLFSFIHKNNVLNFFYEKRKKFFYSLINFNLFK